MKQYPVQQRPHPIFSPVALLSTLLLVVGLAIGVYLTGGRAFSPGELSAVNHSGEATGGVFTHADFADNCGRCHAPFQGIEAARCETCHENVAQQRQRGAGLHGRFANAEQCAACHQEHQGPQFDLRTAALSDFDHEVTRFSLVQHTQDYGGRPLACAACHTRNAITVASAACADCHRTGEPVFMARHNQAFGDDCLACHDGLDTLAQFSLDDHATAFPLVGAHTAVPCETCHAGGQFEGTTQTCAGCHAEPAVHAGLFGTACADCHTADGWTPATVDGRHFDHAADTRFSLVRHITHYDGTPFSCATCHTAGDFTFAERQCADCHAQAQPEFIAAHATQVGQACLACHDGTGQITNFDHSLVWPLEGQHATTPCAGCHTQQPFQGTPRDCVGCHAEPPIHAGLFGTDCAACHTPQAWQPARLVRHTFPLDHGDEGEIPCATCHTLTYTAYTCTNCHEHEAADIEEEHLKEGISRAELPNCARCHPTGREE